MKIRKIAAIAALVLSSFAADNVAPSKTELEAMYDKAFHEFDGGNYSQALKQLDAIDARQPDLAESQNLRGVILMRQGIYDKAESALREALRIDAKFWNARFNLAEIPFLQKNWGEARTRFQDLLSGNANELQGEATQLIQYKILLTYLLEGKENMVDAILAKFELSPDTPAVHFANAAIALHHSNAKEAKDWLGAADKGFSPQLNKLFAESLYEVGWLQKQPGQQRAAVLLMNPEERATKTKALAKTQFEQAQQAMQERDFANAQKLAEEADIAQPNQTAILNLRGEIALEQKSYDEAEGFFKRALKVDGKFREAQFNLAEVPFRKKDYPAARTRFEGLMKATPGGDKNQAAQLIRFKIYLTYLLEGKDARAQKLMEQFQFTGDTPALYYAQAAWEFKHDNATKANDWVTSARKIYPLALNTVFASGFYDLGWLQSAASAPAVASSATDAAAVASSQTESGPAIEPSPIPESTNENKSAAEASQFTLAQAAPAIPGMEATAPQTMTQTPFVMGPKAGVAANELAASGSPAKPEDVPAAPTGSISPAVEMSASKAQPAPSVTITTGTSGPPQAVAAKAITGGDSAKNSKSSNAVADAASTPATVLAPSHVGELSQANSSEWSIDARTLLVYALLLGGVGLLGWVGVSWMRRRVAGVQIYRRTATASGPSVEDVRPEVEAETKPTLEVHSRFRGGPRQVSLQLKASEPSLRRAAMPTGKVARNGSGIAAAVAIAAVAEPEVPAIAGPIVSRDVSPLKTDFTDASVGPVIEQPITPAPYVAPDVVAADVPEEFTSTFAAPAPMPDSETASPESTAFAAERFAAEVAPAADVETPAEDMTAAAALDPVDLEPIGQGQPIPYQISPAAPDIASPELTRSEPLKIAESVATGVGALRQSVETPSFAPKVITSEPTTSQTSTPVTMPEPTQTPTAPVLRTPPAPAGAPQMAAAPQAQMGGAPQPGTGAAQTAVQITFSCEIASMQLTPTFKMGSLQLRPVSRVVSMRLSPAQSPQPGVNLQVTFEISKAQPAGGGLGSMRLTPSQQQRPQTGTSSAFNVAGLSLVSGFESAPVQLLPSQQGQASVHLTASFNITSVEFSPSFDIASILLNAASRSVQVQLPGSAPVTADGPTFEIANVQLGANGDVSLIQLSPRGGAAPTQAAR